MKICPMMTGRGRYFNTIYCYEKECAWWNEETHECSIKNFLPTNKKEPEITSKKISLFGEDIESKPLEGGYHF